jgi:hypothetical protein
VGKFVGAAHHEVFKGVVVAVGKGEGGVIGRAPVLVQLALGQDLDLKGGGEQLEQGFLNGGEIAPGDDVPLEAGGGIEDELRVGKAQRSGVVEPRVDRGGGHLLFQETENFHPDIRG